MNRQPIRSLIENPQRTLSEYALRATAVNGPAGCCAFLGDAGAGKSTLGAAFVRRGWMLVCDDCLRFDPEQEKIHIVPGRGDIQLWPDSIEAAFNDGSALQSVEDGRKRRVQVAGMDSVQPVELNCIYVLTRPEDASDTRIRIEAAPAGEGFVQLVRNAVRPESADRHWSLHQLRHLQRLVETVRICRLIYPRDFAYLQAVAGAISDDLRSGTLTSCSEQRTMSR